MLINKKEHIDTLTNFIKRRLEEFLPEQGFETEMIERSHAIIEREILHIRAALNR